MQRSTVGSLLRSTQAFCGQLCEKETLEYGIAFYCPRYPDLVEANQFREVMMPNSAPLARAFEQCEAWFAERNLRCRRWAPAGGTAAPELRGFLLEHGFQTREWTALAAVRWVDLRAGGDVRILPARALRAAYRDTFLQATSPASEHERVVLADAYAERLDDPPFDMFVALCEGRPAGRCALYQVGDIARVMDLTVLDAFEGRGVETTLLAHVLALAKRLAMRNICAQVESGEAHQLAWFTAAGFEPDGAISEFERPKQ